MTYQRGGSFQLPPAQPGDAIRVHAPDIGVWTVKEVVQHPRWGYFYRIARKRDGQIESTTISVNGVELLRPEAD